MTNRARKPKGVDKRLDLDALQVFDMVMQERNVTRAADRLAITQPAVSHSLARLRAAFKDELFLRTADGVRPTRRAEQLWSEVQDALQTLRRAVLPDSFNPRTAHFAITIAMNDMILQPLASEWYPELRRVAPHLKLSMVMRRGDTESRLLQGTLDVGLGVFPYMPPQIRRVALFSDYYVCVYRRGHPRGAERWTADVFQSIPQLAVSPDGEFFTYSNSMLSYAGVERSIELTVSHFSCVPAIMQKTDMMALLPHYYAKNVIRDHDLVMREPPIKLRPFKFELIWHERTERLPSHAWFRENLAAFCREAFQSETAA